MVMPACFIFRQDEQSGHICASNSEWCSLFVQIKLAITNKLFYQHGRYTVSRHARVTTKSHIISNSYFRVSSCILRTTRCNKHVITDHNVCIIWCEYFATVRVTARFFSENIFCHIFSKIITKCLINLQIYYPGILFEEALTTINVAILYR